MDLYVANNLLLGTIWRMANSQNLFHHIDISVRFRFGLHIFIAFPTLESHSSHDYSYTQFNAKEIPTAGLE